MSEGPAQTVGEDGDAPSLADLAKIRHATYRLFGSLFLSPPGHDAVETVATAASELRREGNIVRGFPFFGSWRAVLVSLEALEPGAVRALAEEHANLLMTAGSRESCPPYESAYITRRGRKIGALAVEVERAYAEAGVVLASGELPDHVGLELEFMSLLCADEGEAWSAGLPAQALDRLARERAFLDDHLGRWLPPFSRRLVLAAGPESFYSQLAAAAHAFVVHDRDLAELLLRSRGEPEAEGARR